MNLPNASKSFKEANPHIFPVQATGRSRGKLRGDGCASIQDQLENPVQPILGRQRCGSDKMNDTEKKFSVRLNGMKQDGAIDGWMYESIRLRLADRTTYTPDFYSWAQRYDEIQSKTCFELVFFEIKGFRRDDAMVKFKVARELYPWAEFQMWELKKSGWNRIY